MSQAPGRPCPACGTNVLAVQRFCSNCGTDMDVSRPPSQYGGPPPQNFPQAQPVPPYAQSPYGQQQQYQQPPQKSNPIAEALGALGLLFFLRRYRPGYRARRQSSGCCGCLIALIILLAIFGTPAYFYYRANPKVVNNILHPGSTSTPTGDVPTAVSTTPPHLTTANINQSVTYAGVDITIVSVQQATAFSNDSSSATNGIIRVNIKEANNSGANASYFYSDIAHLILPDKTSVASTNEMQSIGPDNSTTRLNWLDFPVPTSDKINQLTLVLGGAQDAQISIPLTGKADLSAFQSKTVNPNMPISYAGLNWTLKTATSSLSIGGKQATTGMHYVVLSFNVDNPTSGTVTIGFTDEYMRLKSGDIMNPSTNTTLPLQISGNTTGATGTVTFLIPDNGSAYILIFLARPGLSNIQVTTNFTI